MALRTRAVEPSKFELRTVKSWTLLSGAAAAFAALTLASALMDRTVAETPAPAFSDKPPAPFSPDPAQPSSGGPRDEPDTWIFSGMLQDTHETFSGTLVTGKTEAQFELKLANGATCDGGDLVPSTGLVRLSDITCSDDRVMRALFVPQGGDALKVFGHVGDERFATLAHLLGTEPAPEKNQTAEPKAPPADPRPAPASPSKPDRG